MTTETLWTAIVLTFGLLWAVVSWRQRRRSSSPDGDWGVLTRCSSCGTAIPRWFLLDKGSPRGSYARYRYPIPASCRMCRYANKGVKPLPWQQGESEWHYDERFTAHVAELVGPTRR